MSNDDKLRDLVDCPKNNLNFDMKIQPITVQYTLSRDLEREPGYLAGAGAVTLAGLRLHRKYLLNNSCKIYGT